jgi:hypothetical protein
MMVQPSTAVALHGHAAHWQPLLGTRMVHHSAILPMSEHHIEFEMHWQTLSAQDSTTVRSWLFSLVSYIKIIVWDVPLTSSLLEADRRARLLKVTQLVHRRLHTSQFCTMLTTLRLRAVSTLWHAVRLPPGLWHIAHLLLFLLRSKYTLSALELDAKPRPQARSPTQWHHDAAAYAASLARSVRERQGPVHGRPTAHCSEGRRLGRAVTADAPACQ